MQLAIHVCLQPEGGGEICWGMSVDHLVVRDMDTKACVEFSGNGQWLGARPPPASATPHGGQGATGAGHNNGGVSHDTLARGSARTSQQAGTGSTADKAGAGGGGGVAGAGAGAIPGKPATGGVVAGGAGSLGAQALRLLPAGCVAFTVTAR